MIVKDEEKYIEQCLKSVMNIIDEIIVVDTGSIDNTQQISHNFGANVFPYVWKEDFSEARNYALSKATCDWILILDADEVFDTDFVIDFLNLINDSIIDGYIFTIHNYVGRIEDNDYTIHHTVRLIRNHKGYHYQGAIHEQVISKDSTNTSFAVTNIVIRHYGYLSEVIQDKKKRSRNLAILLKQLQAEPNNAFVLFNLGNEYFALSQYKKAFQLYKEAKANLNDFPAFAPYLYYKMIECCTFLATFKEALYLSEEILCSLPDFTDIVYCKGIVFYHMQQYENAISTFDQCILMGPSPTYLTCIKGCSTDKPNLKKADIYKQWNNYDEAIRCLLNAYQYDRKNRQILIDIRDLIKLKQKNYL
jgi:glycosyltransferase involved in cell wall biosynthesis